MNKLLIDEPQLINSGFCENEKDKMHFYAWK